MRRWRSSVIIIFLFLALVFFQYRLWYEPGGIHDVIHLKQTLAMQLKANESFKKRNDELLFQVQRLQNSPDAVESRARNELGMVKKDETFYQITKNSRS